MCICVCDLRGVRAGWNVFEYVTSWQDAISDSCDKEGRNVSLRPKHTDNPDPSQCLLLACKKPITTATATDTNRDISAILFRAFYYFHYETPSVGV